MTKDECKQVVLDIIADIAPDEDLSNVKPDVRLRDQLELDSMDFLDIVMELRKRHGIEVPEADYIQLASLDSSAEYLTPKFNALPAKRWVHRELPLRGRATCPAFLLKPASSSNEHGLTTNRSFLESKRCLLE